MSHRGLETVYRRFVKESAALLAAFNAPESGNACMTPHRLGREMCTVRLHDAWHRACKELFVASACDEPVTASGQVVAKVVSSRADILRKLHSTYTGPLKKPKWWKPDWGNPRVLLDAAMRLGVANYKTLSLGMSITPSPTDQVRTIRNFLAHRNQETARDVLAIARSYALPPDYDDLVCSLIPPGISIFESWVRGLRTMLRIAVS